MRKVVLLGPSVGVKFVSRTIECSLPSSARWNVSAAIRAPTPFSLLLFSRRYGWRVWPKPYAEIRDGTPVFWRNSGLHPGRPVRWVSVGDVVVNAGGTDWLTPAATLLAVVLGGAVTFGVQHVLTRRRQKGEAKAAARVLQGDLGMAASRLKDIVMDDPRWFAFDDLRLKHWTEQQGRLALELKAPAWEVVQQSAEELRWVTEGMERALAPAGPWQGHQFIPVSSKKEIASFRKGWENATKAYNALTQLAETERVSGLLHDDLEPVGTGEAE